MWSREYELSTDVDPPALWEQLSDIEGWVRWNDGVESIELDGPLAIGVTFRMTPPGEDTLTSTVVELEPGRLISDLTELDGITVKVQHRLDPIDSGGTTITYRIEVSGDAPDEVAEEVGTGVSADFPDVMAGLVAAAGIRPAT